MLAYGVGRRTRETGVRMALGATPRAIVRLVVSEAFVMVCTGLVAGTVAAWWLSTWVQRHPFETDARDPVAFTVALVVMTVAALLACLVPARRASAVDPREALRAQ